MTARLAREAVIWGDTALIAMRDSLRSGGDHLAKQERLGRVLDDWHAATRAAYAAALIGHAFNNGIADPCYRKKLVDGYISAMDELPELAS